MTDTLSLEEQPSDARPGIVYVLTNDSIPGLVKIGRTSRNADLRASELWQTGVPTPFEVYAAIRTINCVELEGYIHRELRKERVHRFREFFAVDPEVARREIIFWAEHQAHQWIGANFDSLTVEQYSRSVSGADVERLAAEAKQPPRLIADALECLTAEEIAGAIERVRAKWEDEHRAVLVRLGIPEDEHWSVFR